MKDYNDLLDRVYELEGLLHLAVNRDNPPSSLADLIRRNGLEIVAAIGAVEQPVADNDASVSQNMVATDDQEDEAPVADIEPTDHNVYEDPMGGDDTISGDDYDLTDYVGEESDTHGVVYSDEEYSETEDFEEDDAAPDADEAGEVSVARKFSFSINDRFRFRRTLFNNSDRDFNMAIASISACHSYREAEEMLVEDYGWNPEDIEVADFLRLVSNYFRYSR